MSYFSPLCVCRGILTILLKVFWARTVVSCWSCSQYQHCLRRPEVTLIGSPRKVFPFSFLEIKMDQEQVISTASTKALWLRYIQQQQKDRLIHHLLPHQCQLGLSWTLSLRVGSHSSWSQNPRVVWKGPVREAPLQTILTLYPQSVLQLVVWSPSCTPERVPRLLLWPCWWPGERSRCAFCRKTSEKGSTFSACSLWRL